MKGLFRTILFVAGFAFISAGLNTTANAADGDLDTSFGTGGKVTVDFDGNPTTGQNDQDTGLDTVIQPDGKIVVIGESFVTSSDSAISALRMNADGSLDTTFATGGRFLYNAVAGISERGYGVAVQSDGKIVLVGRSNSPRQRIVIRLNADGTFDLSFGTNGVFMTPIGSSTFDEPEVVIQPDGKIVIVGCGRNGGLTVDAFSVMRLTSAGALDMTFDSDGEAVTQFMTNDRAYSVFLQPDGKIVVSGSVNNNGGFAFARYKTDGQLDETFGTMGKTTTVFPSATSIAYSMLPLPSGKFLAAGYLRTTNADAVLARYNADGTLDTTFGNLGYTQFGTTSSELFWDLHIVSGKIVGTGSRQLVSPASPDDFMLVRYSMEGQLDTSFGTNGVVYTDFNTTRDTCLTSAMQADGKLVLVGWTSPITYNPDYAVARFKFTPKDTFVDFDGDGITDLANMRSAGIGAPYTWWIKNSSNGAISTFNFGVRPRDVPAPADYDGDGKDDIALWRNTPQTGEVCAFYIMKSTTGTIDIIPFGLNGDTPVVEDYDGDGIDDLSVYRAPSTTAGPGQATWFVKYSANNPNGNITYIPFGMRYGTQADQVDEPYPGDFDGDGKADFTIQRRQDISVVSSATPGMFITMNASGNISYQYFGLFADRILPGDYDGDGKTDICVARGFNINPGNTTWYIKYSSGIPDYTTVFGTGFNFAQGDYDGDGKTDIAYMLTNSTPGATGYWYMASSSNNDVKFVSWGTAPSGLGAIELPVATYNNR